MKKFIFIFLTFFFCFRSLSWAQQPEHVPLRGQAAHSSVYDSLTFSMASWGLGLAVGIGLLCALLDFSSGAHSHVSGSDDD